ncbi:MAG: aldehyde dehydrogenase, partial [Ignavibacteria bacterium RBG_13_36_8]
MVSPSKKEIYKVFELQRQNRISAARTTALERKLKLKMLLGAIYDDTEKIEKAIYADFKKPAAEVKLTEIYLLAKEIKYVLRNLNKWLRPRRVKPPITFLGSSNKIIFEPKGTTLIISPWNYPFLLAINPLVSAIAAGNCAIIKPSEKSPNTSRFIKNFISKLFPENEVAIFEGGKHTAEILLELPFDHVFYTGSSDVGKLVMKAASENLSSITLELGGKSPTIVDETADLANAAQSIVWGKFINAGQTCVAPDYLLIHQSIESKLIDLMVETVKKFYSNDGRSYRKSDYCGIVNEKHMVKINSLVKDAIRHGAKAELGNKKDKHHFSPTILSNVSIDSKIMKEEIFGPVLPVLTYNDEEEILKIVSENPKPLSMYI